MTSTDAIYAIIVRRWMTLERIYGTNFNYIRWYRHKPRFMPCLEIWKSVSHFLPKLEKITKATTLWQRIAGVSDINLPDGSGLDFMKKLNSVDSVRPVILSAANDNDMNIVTGLEQDTNDYNTKLFSVSFTIKSQYTAEHKFLLIFNGKRQIKQCIEK